MTDRIPSSVVAAAVKAAANGSGIVTPDALVAAARAPDHPLHQLFEWRDDIAAQKHRVDQARTLIRSVVYVGRDADNKRVTSIAYVHRPGSLEQGYIPVQAVEKDRLLAYSVVMSELQRCEAAVNRARNLADVFGLQDDLDGMLSEIGVIRTKVDGVRMEEENRMNA